MKQAGGLCARTLGVCVRVQKMIALCRKAGAQSLPNVLETGGLWASDGQGKGKGFSTGAADQGSGRFAKSMLL
jgi:hypothetical protein